MPTETLPTYVGNCEIEEIDRSDLRVDAYGLDTFTRSYAGRKDKAKIEAFVKTLIRGKSDSQYKAMGLENYSFNTDRSFAYFTVNYVGKIDGAEPEGEQEDDWYVTTLQFQSALSATTEEGNTEAAEIEYRAPMTTYRYAMKSRPVRPRYTGKVASGELGIEIIDKRGIASLLNFYQMRIQTKYFMSGFRRRQAGNWWRVEESHEVRLVQDQTIVSISI